MCVQQTVIDLLERGYEVHIVADATSSRNHVDRMFAFEVLSTAALPNAYRTMRINIHQYCTSDKIARISGL